MAHVPASHRARALRRRYGRSASGEIILDAASKAAVDARLAVLDPSSMVSIEEFASEHGVDLKRTRRGR